MDIYLQTSKRTAWASLRPPNRMLQRMKQHPQCWSPQHLLAFIITHIFCS